MVKLLGIFFLVTGSTGFAFCLCMERKWQLLLLKEIKQLFLMMQREIRYTGLPVTEIMRGMANKLNTPFREAFERMGTNLTWEEGNNLNEVWKREMHGILIDLPLKEHQKQLLLDFPNLMGVMERDGQADALNGCMEELDKWILQAEKEEKDKNKLIMSLGTATGVLLSVLLF